MRQNTSSVTQVYNWYVPQERAAFFCTFVHFRHTNLHSFLLGLGQLWQFAIFAFPQPKKNVQTWWVGE
jgi:hypothetical protein